MPERDSFIAKISAVHFVRLMAELSGIPAGHALERAHEALFYVGLGKPVTGPSTATHWA
jgi:ABC-2 type transport system ATP-binding protein